MTKLPNRDGLFPSGCSDERTMIDKLKKNYPKSEIWCTTLSTTFMSNTPRFKFPFEYSGTHIEVYNGIIRRIVWEKQCNLIDLYSNHIPYDSLDGSHPNYEGMHTIASEVIRAMAGEEISAFVDCPDNAHQYLVAEEYTGGIKYVCKDCCKIKHKSTLYGNLPH